MDTDAIGDGSITPVTADEYPVLEDDGGGVSIEEEEGGCSVVPVISARDASIVLESVVVVSTAIGCRSVFASADDVEGVDPVGMTVDVDTMPFGVGGEAAAAVVAVAGVAIETLLSVSGYNCFTNVTHWSNSLRR